MRALPYGDASFSTVVSNSSIEHIPRVDEVLREVARILRPGGRFMFTVPGPRFNDWFWLNWIYARLRMPERGERAIGEFNILREHHHVFDSDTWKSQLEAVGLTDIQAAEYFSFPSTFVFSMLEHFWSYNPRLPLPHRRGICRKQVNLGAAALQAMTRRLRRSIQVYPAKWLQQVGNDSRGSHLLILAKKPHAHL